MSADHIIDPNDPNPRYVQVYLSLIERIERGEFANGVPLPPERKLTNEYGVSRITIVKALDRLQHEGVIERQHGRGTFVSEKKLVFERQTHTLLSAHLREQGINPRWEVVDRREAHVPKIIQEQMHEEEDPLFFQGTVLLSGDEQPIAYHLMHAQRNIAKADSAYTLPDDALIAYLRDMPAKLNCRSERSFEAVRAGENEAHYLDVPPGDPVLMIDLKFFDADGKLVELIRSFFAGNRFRYTI